MATDTTKTKTQVELAQEQREAERKRADTKPSSNPFANLFGGLGGDGNIFNMLGKLIMSLLSGSGLGSLFGNLGKSVAGNFEDFTDNVSGRGDIPLAPKGSKPPEKSVGARIGNTLRTGWNGVLDLIGHHESRGDYNRVYGAGVKRVDLTNMTIDQVQKWQRDYVNSGSRSSAAGKYQIIQDTLSGLKKEMGLTGKELFDEKMQDAMALKLLERRGINSFVAGKMSTGQIINSISKEWAAVKNTSGVGEYDKAHGGNLNRGTLDSSKMAVALEQARAQEYAENRTVVRNIDAKIAATAIKPAATDTKIARTPSAAAEMTKVASAGQETAKDPIANRKTVSVGNGATMFVADYPEGPKETKVASAAPVAERKINSAGGTPVFEGTYGSAPVQVAAATPAQKTDRNLNIAMSAGLNS